MEGPGDKPQETLVSSVPKSSQAAPVSSYCSTVPVGALREEGEGGEGDNWVRDTALGLFSRNTRKASRGKCWLSSWLSIFTAPRQLDKSIIKVALYM